MQIFDLKMTYSNKKIVFLITYYIFLFANTFYCSLFMISFLYDFFSNIFTSPTLLSVGIYLTYYSYICIASIFLPAKIVKGHPNPKRGPQQEYSISGFKLTLITIALIVLFGGIIPNLAFLTIFKISILAD